MITGIHLSHARVTPPAAQPLSSILTPASRPSDDKAEIDWSGARPAHRGVKRLARGAAAAVAALGVGKATFDALTAPSIEAGLIKASLSLAGTAAAVIGVDLASGVGHHWGDNYGPQHAFEHTRWHTDVASTGYCLVGFSNKALDKIGFWPKWEKAIHLVTGRTPISWEVPDYAGFIAGDIDQQTLHQRQVASGQIK